MLRDASSAIKGTGIMFATESGEDIYVKQLKHIAMKINITKGSMPHPKKDVSERREPLHHEEGGMEPSALRALFAAELRDMYWAERYLLKNLPQLINQSTMDELKQAITAHFRETENHVARLEKCFEILAEKPYVGKCEAMEGLLTETNKRVAGTAEGSVARDAGIVSCAHKVECYEIATYTILRTMARALQFPEVEKLLSASLEEEENANIFLLNIELFVDERARDEAQQRS
jgi:ferritin-like metal-binding protein YciE